MIEKVKRWLMQPLLHFFVAIFLRVRAYQTATSDIIKYYWRFAWFDDDEDIPSVRSLLCFCLTFSNESVH